MSTDSDQAQGLSDTDKDQVDLGSSDGYGCGSAATPPALPKKTAGGRSVKNAQSAPRGNQRQSAIPKKLLGGFARLKERIQREAKVAERMRPAQVGLDL
jgi:hypothetical protein